MTQNKADFRGASLDFVCELVQTVVMLCAIARNAAEVTSRAPRSVFAIAAVVSCASMLLTCGVARLTAQVSSKRQVYVLVTDQEGRLVTGFQEEHFSISENGAPREITGLSDQVPISLAVVSEQPWPEIHAMGPGDELIRASSVSDALRQLETSRNTRKLIVSASAADMRTIPLGIEVFQSNPAELDRVVIKLRHQYRLEFVSSTPSAGVEVALHQPRALPPLTLNWK